MKPSPNIAFNSLVPALLIGGVAIVAGFLGFHHWKREASQPNRAVAEQGRLFSDEISVLRSSLEAPPLEKEEVEELKTELEQIETETRKLEAETSEFGKLSKRVDGILSNQPAGKLEQELATLLEELPAEGKMSAGDLTLIQGKLKNLQSFLIRSGIDQDEAFAPIMKSLSDLQKKSEDLQENEE